MAQGLIPLLMSRISAYFPLETIYTPVVHETQHPDGRWPSMEGASCKCSSTHVSLSSNKIFSAARRQWCI